MLLFMIILHILVKEGDAGTTIFYNRYARTGCWNEDDIVRLRARKAFDELIPHVNPEQVDIKYIKNALRYFRKSLNSVDRKADLRTQILLKEAMADTIGAHLRSEMLPAVRFAYYAGYVPYKPARQLHDLYEDIKVYLNTQGMGWEKPKRASQKWSNLTVTKVLIDAANYFNPCSCLVTKRDSNSCIHLPIPKHDDDRKPSVVALPFKTGGLVSLVAPSSDSVLLKYYTIAAKCILSSSPEKCRHSDFVSFNNEMWNWMKRDVAPHLIDEQLYAAYGGVLRIAAAVQNYGKGLSRRNLFEYQDAGLTSWNPWKSLSHSYILVNTDWTPTIYVALVLATAIAIYLVQICYSHICDDVGCRCKARSGSPFSKNGPIVETIVAPVSTRQSTIYYSEKKRKGSETKCDSSASRTQQVYDLNKNEVMAVIMSDSAGSKGTSETESSEDGNVAGLQGPRSPPRLQASISQVVAKPRARGAPLYSSSTVSRTLTGTSHKPDATDSVWSGSASASSDSSRSATTSSKSRRSRNLAWAKKVISKHNSRSVTKFTTRTELEHASATTPTSAR